jgi:hypothetical protein
MTSNTVSVVCAEAGKPVLIQDNNFFNELLPPGVIAGKLLNK